MDLNFPISSDQLALRGVAVRDMNEAQLRQWVDACERIRDWPEMEQKGRKFWRSNLADAHAELERRGLPKQYT